MIILKENQKYQKKKYIIYISQYNNECKDNQEKVITLYYQDKKIRENEDVNKDKISKLKVYIIIYQKQITNIENEKKEISDELEKNKREYEIKIEELKKDIYNNNKKYNNEIIKINEV